jgi:3',5'-cyclic AMP phosphodiesterase CpdA
MNSRLPSLAILLGAVAGLLWTAAPPSLDFVQLSDTHINAIEGIHPEIAKTTENKKDSEEHLRTALHNLARERNPPAFALITGDLVDAHHYEGRDGADIGGQIDKFLRIVDGSRVPVMPVLGNHDLTSYKHNGSEKPLASQAVAAESRSAWSRALPAFRGGTYYALRKEVGRTPYLFINLDDGEGVKGDRAYAEAQIRWLKDQLAGYRTGPAIVTMHIPLQQAPYHEEIMAVLDAAPNVVLAIAGHRHSDGVETVNLGSRSITQVRTAALFLSADNVRRFRLLEDRIVVFATGKPSVMETTVALHPMAIPAGAR